MISPGERGADGAATLVGAAGAAGSSGGGRGTDVLSVTTTGFTGPGAPLNIGAGCEADCRNSTLIRIASVTKTPSTTPTASRRLQPSAWTRYVTRPATGPLFPRPARAMPSRTLVHRDAGCLTAPAAHR